MLASMLITKKKKYLPKFYELGRIYSDAEIQQQVNKIEALEKRIEFYQEKILDLGVDDVVIDLPKLTSYELNEYRTAKDSISKLKRQYDAEIPELKKMESSRSLPKVQPTMSDINKRARAAKSYPSKIIDKMDEEMWKDETLPFYPDYIIQVAKNLRYATHKFKYADAINEPLYPKWLDMAIEQEDKIPNNTNYRKLVDMRIKAWKDKIKIVKENEKVYMEDSVRDHVSRPTKKFSRDFIKAINEGRGKEYVTAQDIEKKEAINTNTVSMPSTPVRSGTPVVSSGLTPIKTSTPIKINTSSPNIAQKGISITPVASSSSLFSGFAWKDQQSFGIWENVLSSQLGAIHQDWHKPVIKQMQFQLDQLLSGECETFDGNMGFIKITIGNPFKDIENFFKNVQREFEKALSTIVRNTIGSQLAKDILPKELYKPLLKLSQASIKILVGKISPEIIGDALEAVYGLTAAASQSVTWIVDESTKAILASPLGRDLDKFSGGLISSVQRIGRLDNDAIDGKKADVGQILMDSIKIGMAIVGGPSSIAKSAATNAVGEKTGLNKTVLGKAVLGIASGSVSGDAAVSDLLKQEAKKAATSEATKQATKALTPILGKDAASIIGAAVSSTTVEQTTGSQNSIVESITDKVIDNTKDLAKEKANEELKRATGGVIGLDEAERIYNLDPNEITKENAKKVIEYEVLKVQRRIELERQKALDVKERIKHEYQLAKAKLNDPNAVEKLEQQIQNEIKKEQDKLASEYKKIQDDMNKALDNAKKFNINDEINKAKNDLEKNFNRELDNFMSITSTDVFSLMEQYGPQLLAYLKYKYGAQPNYDKFITEQDLQNYKTWQPQETIYPPKKSKASWWLAGATVVGTYIALRD